MKKVLLCIAMGSLIQASEKITITNQDINKMTVDGLTIQRAGATDAGDIIRVFSDPEVSRYAFGATATDEQVKSHAQSWGDLFKFAGVLALEKFRGRNYFWTVRDQEKKQTIGVLGLEETDAELTKLLKETIPSYSTNYRSLSIILTKESWGKGYAKNSLQKLLGVLFATPTFNTLHGVCCGVVDQDAHTLNLIQQDGQPKKPFQYLGDVTYPKGLSHIIPNPSVIKYYLINKDDFLNNQNTDRN